MSADQSPPPPEDADALDALLRSVPMNAADALPDPGDIVALHQGQLPAERAAAVETEVAESEFARELLAGLSEPTPDELAEWAVSAIPHRRRARWITYGGIALAAAVLIGLLVPALTRQATIEAPDPYAVTALEGGRSVVRSETRTEGPRVFARGDTLRVFVAPTAGDARPAAAAALFLLKQGTLRPLPARVEPHDGAFLVEAPIDALFDAPGVYELRIGLVLAEEVLAGAADVAPEAAGGVRLVPLTVRYTGVADGEEGDW